MRKRKWKLMKNQNPDHAPEMNLNQGKNQKNLENDLKKFDSGKRLEKEHVMTMKIVKRENVKDQLSLIQKLQKSQKQKRTIN